MSRGGKGKARPVPGAGSDVAQITGSSPIRPARTPDAEVNAWIKAYIEREEKAPTIRTLCQALGGSTQRMMRLRRSTLLELGLAEPAEDAQGEAGLMALLGTLSGRVDALTRLVENTPTAVSVQIKNLLQTKGGRGRSQDDVLALVKDLRDGQKEWRAVELAALRKSVGMVLDEVRQVRHVVKLLLDKTDLFRIIESAQIPYEVSADDAPAPAPLEGGEEAARLQAETLAERILAGVSDRFSEILHLVKIEMSRRATQVPAEAPEPVDWGPFHQLVQRIEVALDGGSLNLAFKGLGARLDRQQKAAIAANAAALHQLVLDLLPSAERLRKQLLKAPAAKKGKTRLKASDRKSAPGKKKPRAAKNVKKRALRSPRKKLAKRKGRRQQTATALSRTTSKKRAAPAHKRAATPSRMHRGKVAPVPPRKSLKRKPPASPGKPGSVGAKSRRVHAKKGGSGRRAAPRKPDVRKSR